MADTRSSRKGLLPELPLSPGRRSPSSLMRGPNKVLLSPKSKDKKRRDETRQNALKLFLGSNEETAEATLRLKFIEALAADDDDDWQRLFDEIQEYRADEELPQELNHYIKRVKSQLETEGNVPSAKLRAGLASQLKAKFPAVIVEWEAEQLAASSRPRAKKPKKPLSEPTFGDLVKDRAQRTMTKFSSLAKVQDPARRRTLGTTKSLTASRPLPKISSRKSSSSSMLPAWDRKKGPQTGDEVIVLLVQNRVHENAYDTYYLNYRKTRRYNPYDLVVVSKDQVQPDHCIISSSGVLIIGADQPTERVTLDEWQRQKAIFDRLVKLRFFRDFLPLKAMRQWRHAHVLHQLGIQKGKIAKLYLQLNPAFHSPLNNIQSVLVEFSKLDFLQMDLQTPSSISTFNDAKASSLRSVQHLVEIGCDDIYGALEDMTADVRDRLEKSSEEIVYGPQSIAQYRDECTSQKKSLEQAKYDLVCGKRCIQLADKMFTETILGAFASSLQDTFGKIFRKVDHRLGVWIIDIKYDLESRKMVSHPNEPQLNKMVRSIINDASRLASVAARPRNFIDPIFPPDTKKQETQGEPTPTLGQRLMATRVIKDCIQTAEEYIAESFEEVNAFLEKRRWLADVEAVLVDWNEEKYEHWRLQCHTLFDMLVKLAEWKDLVAEISPTIRTKNSVIVVNCKPLKTAVLPRLEAIARDLNQLLTDEIKNRCQKFISRIDGDLAELHRCISLSHPSSEEYARFVAGIESTEKKREGLKTDVDGIEILFGERKRVDLELDFHSEVDSRLIQLESTVQAKWAEFLGMLQAGSQLTTVLAPMMTHKIKLSIQEQEQEARKLIGDLTSGKLVHPASSANRIKTILHNVEEQVESVRGRAKELVRALKVVSSSSHDLPSVNAACEALDVRRQIWQLFHSITVSMKEWVRAPFEDLDMDDIDGKVTEWLSSTTLLLEETGPDPVVQHVHDQLLSFKRMAPLLKKMSSPVLHEKHWRSLFAAMGLVYNPDTKINILLFMSHNIVELKGVVDQVYVAASTESDIDSSIAEATMELKRLPIKFRGEKLMFGGPMAKSRVAKNRWRAAARASRQALTQTLKTRKTSLIDVIEREVSKSDLVFLLTKNSSTLDLLSDYKTTLTAAVQSPHCSLEQKNAATDCLRNLATVEYLITRSCQLQYQWLFIGHSLRDEAAGKALAYFDFAAFDSEVRSYLSTVEKLDVDSLLNPPRYTQWKSESDAKTIKEWLEYLCDCAMEALDSLEEGFLPTLRHRFPRCYFLTFDEVVRLFSLPFNPSANQDVLAKCFNGIAAFGCGESDFEDKMQSFPTVDAIIGMDGHLLEIKPVVVDPSDEIGQWHRELVVKMQGGVHRDIYRCKQHLGVTGLPDLSYNEIVDWIDSYAQQSLAVVQRMQFYEKISAGEDPHVTLNACKRHIAVLLDIMRDKSHSARIHHACRYLFMNASAVHQLCLELQKVHNEDNHEDLEKRLLVQFVRYEYNVDHALVVYVLGHQFSYGHEFYGGNLPLVNFGSHTSDLLASFLAMSAHRCPVLEGNSGIGKGDLAVAAASMLGRHMVHLKFEGAFAQGGRRSKVSPLLIGAALNGSCGILEGISQCSSSIPSMVAAILQASSAQSRIEAENRSPLLGEVMDPFTGILLPTNPNTLFIATATSDWLSTSKAVVSSTSFRTIGVEETDVLALYTIFLTMEGFKQAEILAQRLLALLSNVVPDSHSYNFALFNKIRTVAGEFLRSSSSEEDAMVQALQKESKMLPLNIAKGIQAYLPAAFITTPGAILPSQENKGVKEILEQQNLVVSDAIIQHCLSLRSACIQRSPVVIVTGSEGVGKTTCIKATAQLLRSEGTSVAVDHVPALGETVLDKVLPEWMTQTGDSGQRLHWLLVDGAVDTRILVDRFTSPLFRKHTENQQLMCETLSVGDLSPSFAAAVSIIYIEDTGNEWQEELTRWFGAALARFPRLSPADQSTITGYFELVPVALDFVEAHHFGAVHPVEHHRRSPACRAIVRDFLQIFDASLQDFFLEDSSKRKPPQLCDALKVIFAHAYIWGFGSHCAPTRRREFVEFAKTQLQSVATLPEDPFKVALHKGRFVSWQQAVDEDLEYGMASTSYSSLDPNPYVFTPHTWSLGPILRRLSGSHIPVMVTGPPSCGKSALIMSIASDHADTSVYLCNMTSTRGYSQVREMEAQIVNPLRSQCLLIVDDLHLSNDDASLYLHSCLDQKRSYDPNTQSARGYTNQRFLATASLPSSGAPSQRRLWAKFTQLQLEAPSESAFHTILTPFTQQWVQSLSHRYGTMEWLTKHIVDATVATVFHFNSMLQWSSLAPLRWFNLRDGLNVIKGLFLASSSDNTLLDATPALCVQLWLHEAQRCFLDPINLDTAKDKARKALCEIASKNFPFATDEVAIASETEKPTSMYIHGVLKERSAGAAQGAVGSITRVYSRVSAIYMDQLKEYIGEVQKASGLSMFPQPLSLHDESLSMLFRLCRLLKMPSGPLSSAMLYGQRGSGRKSLARLSALLCDCELVEIQVSHRKCDQDFRQQLHKQMKKLKDRYNGPPQKRTVVIIDNSFPLTAGMVDIVMEAVKTGALCGEDQNAIAHTSSALPTEVTTRSERRDSQLIRPRGSFVVTTNAPKLANEISIFACWDSDASSAECYEYGFLPSVNSCNIVRFPDVTDTTYYHWAEALVADACKLVGDDEDILVPAKQLVISINEEIRSAVWAKPAFKIQFFSEFGAVLYRLVASRMKIVNDGLAQVYQLRDLLTNGQSIIEAFEEERSQEEPIFTDLLSEQNRLEKELKTTNQQLTKATEKLEDARQKVAELEGPLDQLRIDAEVEFKEVNPQFIQSEEALKCVTKDEVVEIGTYVNPPEVVVMALAPVCILFRSRIHMYVNGFIPTGKPTWNEAKALVSQDTFFEQLTEFHKKKIPDAVLKEAKSYMQNRDFNLETVATASLACRSMCAWVQNIAQYAHVVKTARPIAKQLKRAEKVMRDTLASIKRKEELQISLRSQAAEQGSQLAEVTDMANLSKERLDTIQGKQSRVQQLIDNSQNLSARNKETLDTLMRSKSTLVGDCIIAAATIAGSGTLSLNDRQDCIFRWIDNAEKLKVAVRENYSLEQVVEGGEDPMVYTTRSGKPLWQSGLIARHSYGWPLIFDPYDCATEWISKVEGNVGRQVVKINCRAQDAREKILSTIGTESTSIIITGIEAIEDLTDTNAALILPLLKHGTYGYESIVQLDPMTVVEILKDFRVYFLHSKELQAGYVDALRFTRITFEHEEAVIDSLLATVVEHIDKTLEEERNRLALVAWQQAAQFRQNAQRVVNQLRGMNEKQFSNDGFIRAVLHSYKENEDHLERTHETKQGQQGIAEKRKAYLPLAIHACFLFQLCNRLEATSITMPSFAAHFIEVLDHVEHKKKTTPLTVDETFRYIESALYKWICIRVSSRDALLFSFGLCLSLLRAKGKIGTLEYELFCSQFTKHTSEQGFKDISNDDNLSYLSPQVLTRCQQMTKIRGMGGLLESLNEDADLWQEYMDMTSTLAASTPLCTSREEGSLTLSLKLLLHFALYPNATSATFGMINEVVLHCIGTEFTSRPHFGLHNVLDMTRSLYVVLCDSSDVTPDLMIVAKSQDIKVVQYSLAWLSTDQMRMILEENASSNEWLVFQDGHLATREQMFNFYTIAEPLLRQHKGMKVWITTLSLSGWPIQLCSVDAVVLWEGPFFIQDVARRAHHILMNSPYVKSLEKTSLANRASSNWAHDQDRAVETIISSGSSSKLSQSRQSSSLVHDILKDEASAIEVSIMEMALVHAMTVKRSNCGFNTHSVTWSDAELEAASQTLVIPSLRTDMSHYENLVKTLKFSHGAPLRGLKDWAAYQHAVKLAVDMTTVVHRLKKPSKEKLQEVFFWEILPALKRAVLFPGSVATKSVYSTADFVMANVGNLLQHTPTWSIENTGESQLSKWQRTCLTLSGIELPLPLAADTSPQFPWNLFADEFLYWGSHLLSRSARAVAPLERWARAEGPPSTSPSTCGSHESLCRIETQLRGIRNCLEAKLYQKKLPVLPLLNLIRPLSFLSRLRLEFSTRCSVSLEQVALHFDVVGDIEAEEPEDPSPLGFYLDGLAIVGGAVFHKEAHEVTYSGNEAPEPFPDIIIRASKANRLSDDVDTNSSVIFDCPLVSALDNSQVIAHIALPCSQESKHVLESGKIYITSSTSDWI